MVEEVSAYAGFRASTLKTSVVIRRVVPTWFEASREEQAGILDLVSEVKNLLDQRDPRPDGYNVGFNAGEVAGQTVMHLHVHVIPRYKGDMPDPRAEVPYGFRGLM